MAYLKACQTSLSTLFFVFMVVGNLFMILINLWLSEWSNQALEDRSSYNPAFYLGVYFALGLLQCNH